MGLSPFSKSNWKNSCDNVNPNIYIFNILKIKQIKNNLVVKIKYPNCINFEGKKILVYTNLSKKEFKNLNYVDPHFSEEGISPFARFEPTKFGWTCAVALANSIELDEYMI